jgi:hypothetical protein
MSDETPPVDLVAAIDQLLRGLADVAKIVRVYHLALIEQGFTQAEALQLTMAYQSGLQRGSDS